MGSELLNENSCIFQPETYFPYIEIQNTFKKIIVFINSISLFVRTDKLDKAVQKESMWFRKKIVQILTLV